MCRFAHEAEGDGRRLDALGGDGPARQRRKYGGRRVQVAVGLIGKRRQLRTIDQELNAAAG